MPRGWSLAMLACAALTPAVLMGACRRQLPGPASCSERLPCDKSQTCVLGRCRKNGTMPVSFDAPRHSFEPTKLAVLADGQMRHGDGLGPAIRLGERDRPVTLLLGFSVRLPEGERVQRALIELSPLPSCPHVVNKLAVELMPITEPWKPHTARAASPPKMGLPMAYAPQRVLDQPLRIDVTELVRDWYSKRDDDHGLALRISGQGAQSSCFSSGGSWTDGPRLDVYLWPEADAGADADAGDAGDADAGDAGDAKPEEEQDE